MAFKQTTSRWKQLLAASVSVLALACGGDDGGKDNDKDDDETPTTGVVLGKGIVGKECTADSDCGNGGSCKKTQGIGGLSDILNLIGLDLSLAAPGGYCSIACSSNANCGEGGVCLGAFGTLTMGECRKGCTAPTDCRDGYECAKPQTNADGGVVGGQLNNLPAQCQALPVTPQLNPNQVGAACDARADAGVALNQACGMGTCAAGSCTATCVNDTTCGAGAVCVPNGFYGTSGNCAESCTVDEDCNQYTPTGTIGCNDVNGRKLCGQKAFPLDPGVLGEACAATTECGRGGTCAETLGGSALNPTPAPDGYCTRSCQDDSVCTGGACVAGILGVGRCYDSCTVDGECRTGYSCQDRPSVSDTTIKVCAPIPVANDAGTAARVVGGLDGGV
jgi:hypothetical protein